MSYQSTNPARATFNPLTNLGPLPSLLVREGKSVRVKLKRSLYFGGVKHDAGDVVFVTEFEALNLRALGRAEIVR